MSDDESTRNFLSSLLPYLREGSEEPEADSAAEWRAGRSILSYGVRVGIKTNEPDLLNRLADYFPPFWRPTEVRAVERLYSLQVGGAVQALFEDGKRIYQSSSLEKVLEAFESNLKTYVAEMARDRVFIRAGAVGWRGRAIIISGRSFSGKTSLVAELVRAGATYYSDEYAVLDTEGCLHPYPQPLAIREPGSPEKQKRPVEEIAGSAGTRPLAVGSVIITRYVDGGRWMPKQISAGQGVLLLLANSVPARRKPEIVLPTLQKAVARAVILKGGCGEARETAELILQKM